MGITKRVFLSVLLSLVLAGALWAVGLGWDFQVLFGLFLGIILPAAIFHYAIEKRTMADGTVQEAFLSWRTAGAMLALVYFLLGVAFYPIIQAARYSGKPFTVKAMAMLAVRDDITTAFYLTPADGAHNAAVLEAAKSELAKINLDFEKKMAKLNAKRPDVNDHEKYVPWFNELIEAADTSQKSSMDVMRRLDPAKKPKSSLVNIANAAIARNMERLKANLAEQYKALEDNPPKATDDIEVHRKWTKDMGELTRQSGELERMTNADWDPNKPSGNEIEVKKAKYEGWKGVLYETWNKVSAAVGNIFNWDQFVNGSPIRKLLFALVLLILAIIVFRVIGSIGASATATAKSSGGEPMFLRALLTIVALILISFLALKFMESVNGMEGNVLAAGYVPTDARGLVRSKSGVFYANELSLRHEWRNTHVTMYPGVKYRITTVSTLKNRGENISCGSEGCAAPKIDAPLMYENFRHMAIIARFGANGEGYYVGKDFTFSYEDVGGDGTPFDVYLSYNQIVENPGGGHIPADAAWGSTAGEVQYNITRVE